MFLLGQAQEASPDERPLCEIERMKHFFLNDLESEDFFAVRRCPEIIVCQGHDQLRRNDLHVPTVNDGKGRAENFVAAHDFVDAALQDCCVARRRQPERVEDIEERQVGERIL